ncbi:MAG TPA: class I adenylate-forming enzyme family protein, partial [Novosphingobium sp.]|nr:class I adenylate-forming enzyme family protein [Novosphingobium sp.]
MTATAEPSAWTPPPGWPAMSDTEIVAELCVPGARFEMETVDIDGVPTRVWKNAPPSLRVLAEIARGHGERTVSIYEDERVSFSAWYRAVAALAAELQRRGVTKGDRVALAMRNLPEWPVALFAATTIGAICVPLNAWWTGPELAFGLANSGSKALICDAERWARIAPHSAEFPALETVLVSRSEDALDCPAEALEAVIGAPPTWASLPERNIPDVALHPDDPATIFYTSGTTGKPKGALGSHRNLMTNILSTGYTQARAALRRGE